MSQGTYANFAETVEATFVNEQCPETLGALMTALTEVGINFNTFASFYDEFQGNDIDLEVAQEEKVTAAYVALCKDFEQKTGLSLCIRYHEADDRGDEVNGAFWEVEYYSVWQYTSAAEKVKDKITRKFWTTWG